MQAGEKESDPALVANEWEEIIVMDGDCTTRPVSDVANEAFRNGLPEKSQRLESVCPPHIFEEGYISKR